MSEINTHRNDIDTTLTYEFSIEYARTVCTRLGLCSDGSIRNNNSLNIGITNVKVNHCPQVLALKQQPISII